MNGRVPEDISWEEGAAVAGGARSTRPGSVNYFGNLCEWRLMAAGATQGDSSETPQVDTEEPKFRLVLDPT